MAAAGKSAASHFGGDEKVLKKWEESPEVSERGRLLVVRMILPLARSLIVMPVFTPPPPPPEYKYDRFTAHKVKIAPSMRHG